MHHPVNYKLCVIQHHVYPIIGSHARVYQDLSSREHRHNHTRASEMNFTKDIPEQAIASPIGMCLSAGQRSTPKSWTGRRGNMVKRSFKVECRAVREARLTVPGTILDTALILGKRRYGARPVLSYFLPGCLATAFFVSPCPLLHERDR